MLSAVMTEIKTKTGSATRLPKQIKKPKVMQGHTFTPIFSAIKEENLPTGL
jgi:hypothetical protein